MSTRPSIFRDNLFQGQTAFVTGGGTGIGWAIAAELLTLGANVVIGSRSEEKLREGHARLVALQAPGKAAWHTCNIREEASIDAAIDFAVGRFGRVDLLVNNGGGQFPSPAAAISARGWNAVIDTNLNGTFLMSRAVATRTMGERGGAIVNIIAQMWNGFPMMAHTGAARAGVENLTKTLALEWASLGIRVNAVAPGVIASSGIENYTEEQRRFFFESTEYIPAGRLGTPREVAAAALFLLSPAAAFVTGATLRVDGGGPLYGGAAANQLRAQLTPRPTDPWD